MDEAKSYAKTKAEVGPTPYPSPEVSFDGSRNQSNHSY